jgi:hypothetical protein
MEAFDTLVRTDVLPDETKDIAGALQTMKLAEQLTLPPV